jgi:hypothetical protein
MVGCYSDAVPSCLSDELVIRMLDEILLPGFEVEFIVESRPAAWGPARRGQCTPGTRDAPTPTSG